VIDGDAGAHQLRPQPAVSEPRPFFGPGAQLLFQLLVPFAAPALIAFGGTGQIQQPASTAFAHRVLVDHVAAAFVGSQALPVMRWSAAFGLTGDVVEGDSGRSSDRPLSLGRDVPERSSLSRVRVSPRLIGAPLTAPGHSGSFSNTRERGLVKAATCARYYNQREGAFSMALQTIGIDLGKTVFYLVGMDCRGEIVVKKRLSQPQLVRYTSNISV